MIDFKERAYARVSLAAEPAAAPERMSAIENISLSGARIRTDAPEPVGSQIELALNLPGEDEIVVQAEVVWNSRRPIPAMGVRFIALEDAAREKLSRFLYRRQGQD